jgi:hypothetical protein
MQQKTLGLRGRDALDVHHHRGEERIRRRPSVRLGDTDHGVHRIEAEEIRCGAVRLRRCGLGRERGQVPTVGKTTGGTRNAARRGPPLRA